MSTELIISILGAFVAIVVSIIGAYLANRNSVILQNRKLKEVYYINFLRALSGYARNNGTDKHKIALSAYSEARNELLLTASSDVMRKLDEYEKGVIGQPAEIHDIYFTKLIKSIRADLKLGNKDLPIVGLKK
ncbi:hypothetical protein [Bacteroides neonati]|uniref:hypothetical protein n=1 Tax=Bacteroides neonati TaxID=1347393 RepID=UPI0005A77004|nr:hypothetical protein [Bacteroides neonati]